LEEFFVKKISAILIGAGQRGVIYSSYALLHPNEFEVVAVAEIDTERRENFRKMHGLSQDMCFSSWEELLAVPKLADAAIICTPDNEHFKPSIKALEEGYHLLLEKPMSSKPEECIKISEHAEKYKRLISICHVLRFTPFFTMLKELMDDGRIGKLISIQHNENVGCLHQAHSYVRGNWRNSNESSPMILAKSCHDLDIMLWLSGGKCSKLSSFGSLTHFKKENAPKGAPERCLDGCPNDVECPYYAPKIYLDGNTGWPASVISNDTSAHSRAKALREGPYGRCVYHCDNNVVDHQVVIIEFDNEVTAAFTMCAFSNETTRTIKLMGTKGEIRGAMEKNEIEVIDFSTGSKSVISLKETKSGHSGGDEGIIQNFVRLLQHQDTGNGLTSAKISLQSHLMAFAAERSRLEKKVIDVIEFSEQMKAVKT
jgi:predicted dehydrogenase